MELFEGRDTREGTSTNRRRGMKRSEAVLRKQEQKVERGIEFFEANNIQEAAIAREIGL